MLGCSNKVSPAVLKAAQCCTPTSQDPVLVPHRLAWEAETNTNYIKKIGFILFWYFHSLFYLHFLCLFSLQVYGGAFAETANSCASYSLRTCRNYTMHKE